MKSFLAKKQDIQRKWHIVDADGAILGRLAAKIASILMGKTKPIYTPNVDTGDFVIVLNAEKIKVTGKKEESKQYEYYTHYPSGHRYVSFHEMITKKPEKVIELAVRRMMPKNTIGHHMMKKLKIYRGSKHKHVAQKPQILEL
jgi:large subunit ribosomal protein L13